jgi:[acyl-carrier-protein] S-malonyltransferase
MEQIKPTRYAVVFPGQGSQYVGMGQEIAKDFSSAIKIFKSAEQMTGLSVQHLSFFGSEEDLMETSITQPCLLTTSIAAYTVFREHFPIQPEFICGHSVGEYAALVAAGVLSFADAIRLIQVRGTLMSKMQGGGMAALKGVTLEEAEELCKTAVLPGGILVTANLNSPEQIVISGDSDSVESAVFIALEKNIKVIPLPVSGAFHSPLMQEAATQFAEPLRTVQFNDTAVPVVSNVTAKPVTNGCEWATLLEQQIVSPVLWEPSIRYLEQQGIEVFVEVGPKQVLSKLINKISPASLTLNVEDVSSLQSTVAELKNFFDVKSALNQRNEHHLSHTLDIPATTV